MKNSELSALALRFLILLSPWLIRSAFASEPCSRLNLRSAQPGVRCETSKGAIFERVSSRAQWGESWRGPDGLVWTDVVDRTSQWIAVRNCKRLGGRLPSREDFERGEANGFREALPNMTELFFWSSSRHPDHRGSALGFSSWRGEIGYDYKGNVWAVRCVLDKESE